MNLQSLHSRFIEGIATFGVGSSLVVFDLLKGGTVILGFMGAVLALLGGWDARQSKRIERKIRELELMNVLARVDKK